MSPLDLDPRFRFDTFIVGPGNRLASAASRRVAESPGSTYNPLFIYSASGLGKTHLVTAIGQHIRRIHPDLPIVYDTLEHFTDEVMAAIEAGERETLRNRFRQVGLLLLDDVQFLAGKRRTQEELLRIWDALSAQGGQVVLTSDRPPTEIDDMDERLLSRFSGGLIVDISAPEYETRVAIARRKAEEAGQSLASGVAEALARVAFGNVRELQGALNRLLAVQELEGRKVSAAEVADVLGVDSRSGGRDEFSDFLAGVSGAVAEAVADSPAQRQLTAAIQRWEGEGYRTRRLEMLVADPEQSSEVIETAVRTFEADVERLREIAGEISTIEPGSPELSRSDVLRDPDRLSEAENLLGAVRERTRPLPAPPSGEGLDRLALSEEAFARRAAAAVAESPGERYNPLFIHGGDAGLRRDLLAGLGRELGKTHPDLELAYLDGAGFAAELIQAIERNHLESWRQRFRRARIFLLSDIEALGATERAQEELFHLFNALHRSGVQLAFTADRAPTELEGFEDRLRTRLESGLVVDLSENGSDEDAEPEPAPESAARGRRDDWFFDREKVLWEWPYPEPFLVEDPD